MLKILTKIDNALEFTEKAIVVALLAMLVLLIAFNIVIRNLFGVSFQQTLLLPPALVLWISLLGATLALKKGRHIKLDILLRYSGFKTRRTALVISALFGMTVMAMLCAVSLSFLKNEWAILGFRGSTALVYPVFFALASFRYLLGCLSALIDTAHPADGRDNIGHPPGDSHSSREEL